MGKRYAKKRSRGLAISLRTNRGKPIDSLAARVIGYKRKQRSEPSVESLIGPAAIRRARRALERAKLRRENQ